MGKTLPVRPQESPWLNTFEAAEYLGVSVRYVRHVLRWEIPVRQSGDRQPLYFHRHNLDLWALEHTQIPQAVS